MNINVIKRYIGIVVISLCNLVAASAIAKAGEITAINFQGEVIGQVISSGMVINKEGESIGYITADSLIIDDDGTIIGGVVPQGIAIGNDNRLLGKVLSDGVVRSLTGRPLGRALPNGLVVDNEYRIIGAILFPGLIYSANGETVGRLTGAGTYTNLDGQEVGFVSVNGYAYRKSGEEYVLDGRLMSSKMVVSLSGDFIGSIAPSGKVIDFEGKEIGAVHANEYVYSSSNTIIGKTVKSGYAFNMLGRYLGTITYNGIVKDGETEIGKYRADGNIVNSENEVIGFSVSLAATANDNYGNFLGRVLPKGIVVSNTEIVGKVGAKGYVYNQENEKIGEINTTGPIFDTVGRIVGEGSNSGSYVSLTGNKIGQMRGRYAFDTNGKLAGGTSQNMLSINNQHQVMGISDISSEVYNGSVKNHVSPFGYLLDEENKIVGSSQTMGAIYGLEGMAYSYIDPNGDLYRMFPEVKMIVNGVLLGKNGYIGSQVTPMYALNYSNNTLGRITEDNRIINKKDEPVYKIVPGGYVVENNATNEQNLVPIRGYAGDRLIAVNFSGDLLGYANSEGKVIDLNGNSYGTVQYGNYVSDNNNSIVGYLIPFTAVVNDKCSQIGLVNGRGMVVNNRDVIVGRILPNGQAISDIGGYIGNSQFQHDLVDFDGNYISSSVGGNAVDYNGNALGCINKQGIIVDSDNKWRYGVVTPDPVIDFENNIIGYVLKNGSVTDGANQILGSMQPNGNVISKSKKNLGEVMRYKVAFSNDNTYLGMVQSSGQVRSASGEIVGQINFDGSVINNGELVGYALYDWYVYTEEFVSYGYITKDGTVLNFTGSRVGRMDKGFVIDKNNKIVARGNRDYTIRDVSNNTIGELQLDGNVIDYDNKNIGYLTEEGAIHNTKGDEIAKAYPLQYYIVREGAYNAGQADWVDTKKVKIQDYDGASSGYNVSNLKGSGKTNRRVIGIALNPDGDIIGNIYDDNKVYDDNENQVGFRTPDGMIVDMNYNPIGVEEIKNSSLNNMFVPAGTFGSGNAYGIGSIPSNLGPGGGYGQGERYDPSKASALSQLQNARRDGITVGQIKSGIKVSNFTGYEEDGWPGTNRSISSWRVNMTDMILEDKPIPAVLARSVYASDGLGANIPVTAIVERNIFSEEGRNIVIPAGSRVIGALGGEGGISGNSGGAVKIGITWKRLIRPDGSQFMLGSAQTADAQGRAGAIGYLDQQLLKKYTEPLLVSAVENLSAYMIASGEGSETSSEGETKTSSKSEAAEDARQNFIDQMDTVFKDIIEAKSNIRSVTYIPAGTRIIIFPNQDLWLNSEKRSATKSEEGMPDTENGLTSSHLDKVRSNPENVNKYNSTEYAEDIEPTGGDLLEETPTRRKRRRNIRQPVAVDSGTINSGAVKKSDTDPVPALL